MSARLWVVEWTAGGDRWLVRSVYETRRVARAICGTLNERMRKLSEHQRYRVREYVRKEYA